MSNITRSVLPFAILAVIAIACAGVVFLVNEPGDPAPEPTPAPTPKPVVVEGPDPALPDRVSPKPGPTAVVDDRPRTTPEPIATPGPVPPPASDGGVVTGRIVDPNASPVSGAKVEIRARRTASLGIVLLDDPVASALSDAKGGFRLEGVPAGAEWAIFVDHGDFPPAKRLNVRAFADSASDVGTIELVAGARVSGVVRSVERGPLEGVEVRVVDARVPEAFGGRKAVTVTTGAGGRFAFGRLLPGAVHVETRPPDHAPAHWKGKLVAGSVEEGIELLVDRGKAISGTVVDDLDAPVAGARVIAAFGQEHADTTTGPDGRFTLAHLRGAGVYLIAATKPGYGNSTGTSRPNEFSAGTAGIKVVLERRGRINGRVTDFATGEPVREFMVRWGTSYAAMHHSRRFDSKMGEFDILELLPLSLVFEIRAAKHAAARLPAVRFSPGHHVRNVEVRLRGGGGATGRVVDRATGKPVAGAAVIVFDRPAPQAGRTFGQNVVDQRRVRRTTTDETGRYRLANLIGEFGLAVRSRDHATTFLRLVRFSDGRTEALDDIRLGQGGVVTGFVKAASGGGDPNAEILMQDEAGVFFRKVRTDANGRFTLPRVPIGRYQVIALQREGKLALEALMPQNAAKRTVEVTEAATVVVEL